MCTGQLLPFQSVKHKELTVQVREDDGMVVRASQQVVGVDREAHSSYFVGVRLERLHDASTAHVPQHTRRVLVAGCQQTAGRLNTHRRKCTTYTVQRHNIWNAVDLQNQFQFHSFLLE